MTGRNILPKLNQIRIESKINVTHAENCISPSPRLPGGARQCGVSGRNAWVKVQNFQNPEL